MKARAQDRSINAQLCVALVLAAHALAAPIFAQASFQGRSPDGHAFSVNVAPERLEIGSLALVDIEVEGVSASSARIVELVLDPALKLEAESLRPGVGGTLVSPRTSISLELRVQGTGELAIRSLVLAAANKSIALGPIILRPAQSSAKAGGEGTTIWRWVAPDQVYRYEAFKLTLESSGGAQSGGLPPDATAMSPVSTFSLPGGASVEASGPLSWTVIAFEDGDLLIPEATIGSGSAAATAQALKIAVKNLPPELSASRAIGSFNLALTQSEPAAPEAGEELHISLVLEGKGNIPALVLPKPVIALNGHVLSAAFWSANRLDQAQVGAGWYTGSASLVLVISPPSAGELSLSFPPVAVLDTSAGLRVDMLSLATRDIRIRPTAPASAAASPSRDAPVWGPGLSAASAAWARDDKGKALALVYAALRRAPAFSRDERDAKAAALACASLLGVRAPLLDALPPPFLFTILSSLVALAALALFIVAKARRPPASRPARHAPHAARRAFTLFVLALALAGLGLASASERREAFAVVWTTSLKEVPSVQSELSVSVIKGSTARLRGFVGKYAGLVLADGVEGWAPRESLFWY